MCKVEMALIKASSIVAIQQLSDFNLHMGKQSTVITPYRVLKQVRVVHVLTPPTPSTQTPVKVSPSSVRVSVITTPPSKSNNNALSLTKTPPTTSSLPSSSSSSSPLHLEDPLKGLPNGLPHQHTDETTADIKKPKAKTPSAPKTPLSPELCLDPADYRYEVEHVDGSAPNQMVKASMLSRPKGALSPKKLKIFLRNAMCRPSEKHPLTVKASASDQNTVKT
jgi:hypothetical protein